MTPKRKFALASIIFAFIVAAVLTNPSEDRHLDQFVRNVQAWQAQHVQSCDSCDSVADAEDLRLAAVSGMDQGGILVGGGLRRESYLFFSVLTHEGMRDARTIGFLGCVFGPFRSTPFPCPQQNTLDLPDARYPSDLDVGFRFSLLPDGSLEYNGEPVSRDELKSRLDAIVNKEATTILIEAHPNSRVSKTEGIEDWVSSLGFEMVMVSVTREVGR